MRRAYERGRLRHAAVRALLLVPVGALAAAGGRANASTAGALAVLTLVMVALWWRGLDWGRGAEVGLAAGSIAFAAPFFLAAVGLGCSGDACSASCRLMCSGGGVVSGVMAGVALSRHPSATFAVAVTLVSVAFASVGCIDMGLVTAGTVVATLVVTELLVASTLGLAHLRR
jgi:hypothetical protein